MNWLRAILDTLFPLRRHLLEEIDYLRAQVAQKQRRIDELQDALLTKPIASRAESIPRGTPPAVPSKPLGWDAFRRAQKESDDHTDTRGAGSTGADAPQQAAAAGDAAGNAAASA